MKSALRCLYDMWIASWMNNHRVAMLFAPGAWDLFAFGMALFDYLLSLGRCGAFVRALFNHCHC